MHDEEDQWSPCTNCIAGEYCGVTQRIRMEDDRSNRLMRQEGSLGADVGAQPTALQN